MYILLLQDNQSNYISSNPVYAATKLFQFLPLESEILGVFKPVARKILQLFQKECCIPVVTEEDRNDEADMSSVSWMIPSEVILGDSTLRKIITPSELQEYLNLHYMSSMMQNNINPALLAALGVHCESLDYLLEISKSHLKVISQEPGKLQQTLEWIGKWLLCVSEHLERSFDASQESLKKIRSATVFPVATTLVNLNDIAVFFPFSKDKKNHLVEG